ELRNAANTKWNVDLAEARTGIGGECLPKDIKFLINAYPTAPLLHGAIIQDSNYQAKLTPQNTTAS
ncbi:MAG: nucleotide sugar dehydrogenase, partial [Nitrososphaerota archaeon]|nr:nucleotide sugar dehydrogenase [Nitrososphaerota archaeon]